MKSKTKKIKLRDEIKVFTQGVSCVMGVGGRRGRRRQRASNRKRGEAQMKALDGKRRLTHPSRRRLRISGFLADA